jgi:hypothetical protein
VEIFQRKAQNSKFSFFIALLLLFFLSGMRHEVGKDWHAYLYFYNNTEFTYKYVEIGYSMINDLFSTMGLNYNIFLFAISFITLLFIYKVGINLKYKLIFLFVYFSELFLYLNFSGMRQGIAIAITLFSVKYIMEKRMYHFFVTVGFATLFHFTAIVFIVSYFIYWFRRSVRKDIFIFSFLALGVFFLDNFIELIIYIFYDNNKIVFYLNNVKVGDGHFNDYIIGILKRTIVLLFYVSIPNKIRQDSQLKNLIQVYFFGFLIFLFFYLINGDVGARLGAYFLIMDILIISTIFQQNIHIHHKMAIFLIVFMMYFYKLYNYASLPEYSYKVFL